MVKDLSAHSTALFPQDPGEPLEHGLDFDALLEQSQRLAMAMGRIVRINPDRTLDVVARVSRYAALRAYKGLPV